ncbi:MAG: MraY family glycosyltransferase [Gammaproteobacteria bacterium]|jgi:UDP-GlcNAc:undecaprenyl-phosphate GlcNAc-1-phosphate transferase|nr:MraY family glycosyltransferase [Gammaproteobacteria bacterium]MDP6615774.1 MraY family glycosyltransferase [Gammaproteobacteria bacterium]MDP6695540.1 MraY family glycosyltransferase [Gammaproteobacteria bacterium]
MNFVGPILAFAATAVLIILLRPLAIAVGLVDVPSRRKTHSGDIPLIGGMAIFVGSLVALATQSSLGQTGVIISTPLPAFFAAAFVLILVGAWDDYADLPPVIRFLAQIVACLIMIFGGNTVLTDVGQLNIDGSVFNLGWMAVPFTVFACLGVINAMNMCDGLDGLSGSLALIALLGLGIANTLWGSAGHQHLIVVFAACVISFLMFNLRTLWRPKAWVFLGDAGSMLLGLTLSWLAICLSQGEERVISPAAALWFLMLPVYDAVAMMVRRLLKRQSPFRADREHLHHIFLMAGFSVGESVTLMSGIAVAGVVIGLGGVYLEIADSVLAAIFLVGGILYYWVIRRAWRVMRFLRRSICRRSAADRRNTSDRRDGGKSDYAGPERRSGADRRQQPIRRTGDDQVF